MNNDLTAPMKLVSFTHKGKSYSFRIEGGFPLTPDRLGSLPKKVMKQATKEWRKLNPPRDRFEMPKLSGPYALVLLKDWLAEKMGAK